MVNALHFGTRIRTHLNNIKCVGSRQPACKDWGFESSLGRLLFFLFLPNFQYGMNFLKHVPLFWSSRIDLSAGIYYFPGFGWGK
jgi:hypothetical protein